MATKNAKIASILLSVVMALSLTPSFAVAANDGPSAQGNATEANLQPATIAALNTTQAAGDESLQTMQEAGKPSQAIQANGMSVFVGDKGKNLGAKVVEPASGGGALSYAVLSGDDCVSVESNGALTFKKAGTATITVTAAETGTHAQTSVDVPIKIYDHCDYTFTVGNTIECVDYYGYYPINKVEIKLKNGNTVVGSATINSPKKGSSATISATGFANRIEMTAEIQQRKNTRSASETLDLNGGGRFEIEMNSRGTIVLCDYGITLPEPDYVAPVAKPNLTAAGNNQLLIYPGSVLSGGQHMEYTFGTKDAPNNNGWTDNYGFMRAKDPGDYYVWWKTASRDRRSLMYFSGGRLDTAPQCMKVTIGKGSINPTVSIDDWTYGETPKTPTVSGNTGNGAVTYSYSGTASSGETYGPSADVPTQAGAYTVKATIADTGSYNGGTATAGFTIAKADVPDQEVRVVGYVRSVDSSPVHWEANIEQSLAGMMPNDAGKLTYVADAPIYKNGATTLPDGVITSFTSGVDSNGMVTARLEIPSSAVDIPEGVQEITLPVTVSAQKNYKDATIKVVVVPTKRVKKTVTIANAPASKTYGDNKAFTLTATVDDEGAKEGDWYWYSSDPKVLEVNAVNGSNQMQVHVRGAGTAQIMAWYEPSDSNTIGAAVTQPITVNKAPISPSVSIEGWTYGDTSKAPAVAGNAGNGAVTYSYSGTTRGGTAFGPSDTAPTQAGEYTVTATVAKTDNYLGGTCTKVFSIKPKPVPVTVTAEDKTYDGTTNVNVFATMKASDLVDGDLIEGATVYEDGTVGFPGLSGTFNDASAGQNKPIKLNISGVTYPVAETSNYEATLSGNPTATIKPRPVYVKAEDKSSRHGENLAELTYSSAEPNDSSGLVGSDTLAFLGVTASTTASSNSDVGEYSITLSGGTANSNYDVNFVEGGTYTITQAEGLTKSIRVVGALSTNDSENAWVANITQPLSGIMPDKANVLKYEAGTPIYNGATTLPTDVTFTPNVNPSSGVVTAKLSIPSTATDIPTEVQQITLPVTVKSKNYKDSTINVVVVPTKKTYMTVSIAGAPNPVIYRDTPFALTATVKDAQGNVVETKAGDWYWYSSDPSVLEVPAIGNPNTGLNTATITVHNPGSAMIMAWYEPGDKDTIGAAFTEPITVNKMSISPSVSIKDWEYGEAPKAPLLAEGSNPGGCTVTYEYKAKDADDGAYSEDIPTEAGKYTVRATVPESTYHKGDTCTADFTITKKPVEATVIAENKTYDGTAETNVSATVSAGVFEEDVVTVSGLGGTFADANAGVGKTVTIDRTGATIAGEGAANYEVAIPETATASIEKRPVSVKADDKSSSYGAPIATLTYSLDGSSSLAEGDTLSSLGITASTTATSTSIAGEYPITLSGGTANPNYKVTLGEDGTYTIEKPVYRPTEGSGSSWAAGDNEGLTITFKRSVNDGETFKHFVGIHVDGVDVAETDYDAVPGSVVVTLHASFLKTLEPGDHTITALFDDGDPAQAAFSVKSTPAPATKASRSGSSIAKTGDALPASAPVAALALVAIAAVAALYARRQVR